ncbi:MAG: response regulator transcription factor [Anaerolineales bacterium]|nr:response regulator transcription factor [Anaerolineales bacterium]
MTDMIRILVVDDHAIVRDGIKLIMETVDELEVIGEAANGRKGLEQAEALKPDVVLMDLRMPEMDGLTAIKHLREDHPEIAIIILTTYNEDDLMYQGLQLGAQGYLLKDVDRQTLIRTIKAVAQGETLLQPEILQRILNQGGAQPSAVRGKVGFSNLTEREIEVLNGVAAGERNKEIAYRLGISERTIKAHLTHIFNKLGVDSRAGAVAVGAENGLLSSKKK